MKQEFPYVQGFRPEQKITGDREAARSSHRGGMCLGRTQTRHQGAAASFGSVRSSAADLGCSDRNTGQVVLVNQVGPIGLKHAAGGVSGGDGAKMTGPRQRPLARVGLQPRCMLGRLRQDSADAAAEA